MMEMASDMATKLHLAVFFILIISNIYHIKGEDIEQDDIEQYGSTMLKQYDEGNLESTSYVNPKHWRLLRRGSCKKCGVANMNRRVRTSIVDGYTVKPSYKYPWMVAVKNKGKISCTGSIINEYFILTAAHCFIRDFHKYEPLKRPKGIVSYIPVREISIRILNAAGPQVRRLIPHPGFTISKWKHDIALLQLKGRIICNGFVSPICLPPYNFAVNRLAIMTISGYGSDDGTGEPINYLKEAKVRQVSFRKCTYPRYMKERMYYCMIGVNKKQTACYGDSGGPMFYKRFRTFYVVGVASINKQCDTDEPFLYTSVREHLNWIHGNIKGSSGYSVKGNETEEELECSGGAAKNATEAADSGASEIEYPAETCVSEITDAAETGAPEIEYPAKARALLQK